MAVTAFDFVIEKFDLFLLTLPDAALLEASRRSRFEKLSGFARKPRQVATG